MKTNEFRDSIAKVKSGRKEAAGSGNLKDFFEVWLNQSGLIPASTFAMESPGSPFQWKKLDRKLSNKHGAKLSSR